MVAHSRSAPSSATIPCPNSFKMMIGTRRGAAKIARSATRDSYRTATRTTSSSLRAGLPEIASALLLKCEHGRAGLHRPKRRFERTRWFRRP
jgi:hypothetical protein